MDFNPKPTRSKLLAEVQNLMDDINKMDDQLKDTNQRLSDTKKSKQSVDDSINQLLNGFTEVRNRIQSIADQRNSIRKELEFKQRECQWLTEMRDMSKEKDKLLEEKISKKQKKKSIPDAPADPTNGATRSGSDKPKVS